MDNIHEIAQSLHQAADMLNQIDTNGTKGTTILGDSLFLLQEQAKQVMRDAEQVLSQDGQQIAQQLETEIHQAGLTNDELAKIEAQHKADDERRQTLDENLKKLEEKFDDRHKDVDPAKREELREQLHGKFDELKQELEMKILEEHKEREAERQRQLEAPSRDGR